MVASALNTVRSFFAAGEQDSFLCASSSFGNLEGFDEGEIPEGDPFFEVVMMI